MDDQEFNYRENIRQRNRLEERKAREESQRERDREREERKNRQQMEKTIETNQRERAKLEHQLVRDDRRYAEDAAAARIHAEGNVIAEQVREGKELRLKILEVQQNMERLRREQQHDIDKTLLEHQLDGERQERDFLDEVKRANLRVQEHGFISTINRVQEDLLRGADHQRKVEEMREKLLHKLLDKRASHILEKDRMTHETNEKIRFAYAMADLKRAYEGLTEEEIMNAILKNMDKIE